MRGNICARACSPVRRFTSERISLPAQKTLRSLTLTLTLPVFLSFSLRAHLSSVCSRAMSAAAGTAARRFRNAKDFNAPDADLVIRSSVLDAANIGVNFKVNIAKLATSPVFRDMAEISGPDAQTADAASGGLPVLYLDEDAFTVCNLLKLIYNGEKGFPDFPKATEADMSNLYAACWKYDLPVARLAVEQALLFVQGRRLRAILT